MKKDNAIVGLALILLGMFFLLETLGFVSMSYLLYLAERLWPLALIIIGILLIFKNTFVRILLVSLLIFGSIAWLYGYKF